MPESDSGIFRICNLENIISNKFIDYIRLNS